MGICPEGEWAKQKRDWDDKRPHGEGCGCMSPDPRVMGTLMVRGIRAESQSVGRPPTGAEERMPG